MRIYQYFVMRDHNATSRTNDPASWIFSIGGTEDQDLKQFDVAEVENPLPTVRTYYSEIDGMNGALDGTEFDGRPTYERKNVRVVLQREVGKYTETFTRWLRFVRWHGRNVDFAFKDANSVEWYFTGRCAVAIDYNKERVTLTFDCEPFAKSVNITEIHTPVTSRVYSGLTADKQQDSAIYSIKTPADSNVYVYGEVGGIAAFTVTADANKYYTIASRSKRGGEVTLSSTNDATKTYVRADSNGLFNVFITLDGSNYDYTTVDGQARLVPCFFMDFNIIEIAFKDSSGEVYPSGQSGFYAFDNAIALPVFAENTGAVDALVSVDGVFDVVPKGETEISGKTIMRQLVGIRAPGEDALKSETGTDRYISAFTVSNNVIGSGDADVTFYVRREALSDD